MCSIPIVRENWVRASIQQLTTPDLMTCKNTAYLSKYSVKLCTIQWMHITHAFFILYESYSTYYENPASRQSSTSSFSYNLHTIINAHTIIQKFLSNDHHKPLHYYVSVQSYIHPSFAQENNYHFIYKNSIKNSSHLTSSFPVVVDPLEAPHYIVGWTTLDGNTGYKTVPMCKATDYFSQNVTKIFSWITVLRKGLISQKSDFLMLFLCKSSILFTTV